MTSAVLFFSILLLGYTFKSCENIGMFCSPPAIHKNSAQDVYVERRARSSHVLHYRSYCNELLKTGIGQGHVGQRPVSRIGIRVACVLRKQRGSRTYLCSKSTRITTVFTAVAWAVGI